MTSNVNYPSSDEPLIEQKQKKQKSEFKLKNLPFFEVIFWLNHSVGVKSLSKEDFFEAYKNKFYVMSDSFEDWQRTCTNLILFQSADTEYFALAELVTNARDANIRAGNTEAPVIITLEGDRFIVEDQGDAVGWKKLPTFLVPGLSSNAEAIFDLSKSEENITGRFGKGKMAPLNFVMGKNPLGKVASFFYEKDAIGLDDLITINGFEYKVKARSFLNSEPEIKIEKVDPKRKKNIVHSYSEDGGLKLTFFSEQDKVLLNIGEKFKASSGTRFEIRSPKLSRMKDIRSFLKNEFEFMTLTPIILDGEVLNFPKGYSEIPFSGGVVKYVNQVETTKNVNRLPEARKECKLRLCENGRTILTFNFQSFATFPSVAILFDKLPLVQDRKSVDFSSLKAPLLAFIDTLFSKELSNLEKSYLLNSLHPLFEKADPEIIERIQLKISECATFDDSKKAPCIPALKEFMHPLHSHTYYFHPDFLPLSKFPKARHISNPKVLEIAQKDPIGTIGWTTIRNETVIFLDASLISGNNYFNILNFSILDECFERVTKKTFTKNARDYLLKYSSTPSTKAEEQLESDFAALKTAESQTEETLEITALPNLLKSESPVAAKIVTMISNLPSNARFKPPIYVIARWQFDCLIEWIEKHEELATHLPPDFWNFSLKLMHPFSSKPSPDVFKIIHRAAIYLNNLSLESKETFIIFLIQNIRNLIKNEHSFFMRLDEKIFLQGLNHYEDIEKVVSSCGFDIGELGNKSCLDFVTCFASPEKRERFFLIKSLIESLSVSQTKRTFFSIFHWFSDLTSLLELDAKQLEAILLHLDAEFAKNDLIDLSAELKGFLNKEHVAEILRIVSSNLSDEHKKHAIKCLICLAYFKSDLNIFLPNTAFVDFVLKYFKKENTEKFSSEKFISVLKQLLDFSNEFISILNDAPIRFLLNVCQRHPEAQESLRDLESTHSLIEGYFEEEKNEAYLIETKDTLVEDLETDANDLGLVDDDRNQEYIRNTINDIYDSPIQNAPLSLYQLIYYGKALDKANRTVSECENSEILDKKVFKEMSLSVLQFGEQLNCITDDVREALYVGLLGDEGESKLDIIEIPEFDDQKMLYLHELPVVRDKYGPSGKIHVMQATSQNQDSNFWTAEYIKNSIEAGATEIRFDLSSTSDEKLVIKMKDNGSGMGEAEKDALLVPGRSTKVSMAEKEKGPKNFGWGHFSGYAFAERISILTSKGFGEVYCLDLCKKEDSLAVVEEKKEKNVPSGTEIQLIRSPTSSVGIESLIFQARLKNLCRTLDVDIYLDGKKISNAVYPPYVEHSEVFGKGTSMEDMIKIELSHEGGGIFRKKLKCGEVEKKYLTLIPHEIQDLLEKENMHFRIFMERSLQIMTRSSFAGQQDLDSFLQNLCFIVVQKYVQKKLLQGSANDLFSRDIFDDFRIDLKKYLPSSELSSFEKRKIALVEEIKKKVAEVSKEDLSFLDVWGQNLLDADKRKQKIKTDLKQFLIGLWDSPLCEKGLSLLDLRLLWQEKLKKLGLIDASGDYSDKILTFTEEEVKGQLTQITKELHSEIGNFYIQINEIFKDRVADRVSGIFAQTKCPKKDEDPLTLTFFKLLAKSAWQIDLDIQFCDEKTGVDAYVLKNKMFVNLRTTHAFIKEMKETYIKSDNQLHEVIVQHSESLRHWIYVLCHERRHMLDGTDCISDHGSWFEEDCSFLMSNFVTKGFKIPNGMNYNSIVLMTLNKIFKEQ